MICMVDTNNGNGYPTKPPSSKIGLVRARMTACDIDRQTFIREIGMGCAWMPGVMRGGMTRAHWQRQQLIGLDFDNKNPGALITVEEACKRLNEHGIPAFCAYQTYSSTPENPRFRVVIALDEPCEDPDVMEAAIKQLLLLFPEADQKCSDLSRLFFGAADRSAVIQLPHTDNHKIDIRGILDLKLPDGAINASREHKPSSEAEPSYRELRHLKDSADLYAMACRDAGGYGRRSGKAIVFRNCPVCGHHDCFAYYPSTNTWTCFSTSNTTGITGGSAIDYIMATKGVSTGDAIHFLRSSIGTQQ